MIRRVVPRLRALLRRPVADQWLALQTWVLLGVARVLIDRLPFPRLERLLGSRFAESGGTLDAGDASQVRRVSWAIERVSPHTPWNSNCFPQALAAKWLLRRRGVASTLYLGAKFDPSNREQLMAHAWLRAGTSYVTGGNAGRSHGAVASFA